MAFGQLGVLGLGLGALGNSVGGPFLLKVDGASRIVLAGGGKLLITGSAPAASGGTSGSPIGLLLSLTYP